MKKFNFSGINQLQSVNTNLVKIQHSNIKISHNILKLVPTFDVEEHPLFLEYDKDDKAVYLLILKDNSEEIVEQCGAKYLDPKYYTFSNAAIAGFVGGALTELNADGEVGETDEFIYVKLKTVVNGEEARKAEKERKAKRDSKTSISEIEEISQSQVTETEEEEDLI